MIPQKFVIGFTICKCYVILVPLVEQMSWNIWLLLTSWCSVS